MIMICWQRCLCSGDDPRGENDLGSADDSRKIFNWSTPRNVKLNISYDLVGLLLPGSLYRRQSETQLNAPFRPFWRSLNVKESCTSLDPEVKVGSHRGLGRAQLVLGAHDSFSPRLNFGLIPPVSKSTVRVSASS